MAAGGALSRDSLHWREDFGTLNGGISGPIADQRLMDPLRNTRGSPLRFVSG